MIDLVKLKYEEKAAIEELRKRVENIFPMDLDNDFAILYRFLKARDFNLDKGEKMLRKHLTWRKANQISTILKDFKPKEFFRKHVEMCVFGTDKEEDLVVYIALGKLDARDCLKCTTMNKALKHFHWQCEKFKSHLMQNSDKEKSIFSQAFIIVDLENLTFANTTNKISMEICTRLLHLVQDNYPEGMKSIFVINAPGYYVIIYSILRALMSNAMVQKIRIYGCSGWQDPLLELVDANYLPVFLGGKRTDPDGNPLCQTFVRHGGKMPSRYYLSDEERYFKDKSRIKHLFVPASSGKEIYVDVQKEASVIHWEFLIKGKDIGFGLFFKETEGMTELLPIQRVDTIDGVETGSYRAKLTGKYIIIFDNSYSWLSSKDIEYCITIRQDV